MERETLKSRLGFILLSAGCAIGIGNVWKFPYIAGQGGGGAFVLFYLLMMFYTTVAGWMLHYFYMTAAGKLAGLNAEQVAGKFTEMLASPATMTFWMVFVVVVSILVCAKGLQSGLERAWSTHWSPP